MRTAISNVSTIGFILSLNEELSLHDLTTGAAALEKALAALSAFFAHFGGALSFPPRYQRPSERCMAMD